MNAEAGVGKSIAVATDLPTPASAGAPELHAEVCSHGVAAGRLYWQPPRLLPGCTNESSCASCFGVVSYPERARHSFTDGL